MLRFQLQLLHLNIFYKIGVYMIFELKDLPYPKDALAPHISEETMHYHHSKHVQAYVDKTNKFKEGTEFAEKPLEEIVKNSSGGLYNNAAQLWNHEFFWPCMSPNGGGTPSGSLADAIDKSFGSFNDFKEKFKTSAAGLFGSGWTWLAKNSDGSLEIVNYSNAGNPLTDQGKSALLGVDVWEHAYYIDYRNARPKYLDAFFEIINWDYVAKNFG